MIRKRLQAEVISVQDDVFDPAQHKKVTAIVNKQIRELVVTKKFAQEHNLKRGAVFTWDNWSIPLLNFFINPVQDVTKKRN